VQYATIGLLLGILGKLDSSLSNGTRIASGICVSDSAQVSALRTIDDCEILSSFHSLFQFCHRDSGSFSHEEPSFARGFE
jgi:hypothetical protein